MSEIDNKYDGMGRAERKAPQWYKDRLLDGIITLAKADEPFNSDDVRELLVDAGFQIAWPLAMGGAFNRAAKLGLIRRTGGFDKQPLKVAMLAVTHCGLGWRI